MTRGTEVVPGPSDRRETKTEGRCWHGVWMARATPCTGPIRSTRSKRQTSHDTVTTTRKTAQSKSFGEALLVDGTSRTIGDVHLCASPEVVERPAVRSGKLAATERREPTLSLPKVLVSCYTTGGGTQTHTRANLSPTTGGDAARSTNAGTRGRGRARRPWRCRGGAGSMEHGQRRRHRGDVFREETGKSWRKREKKASRKLPDGWLCSEEHGSALFREKNLRGRRRRKR